MITVLTLLGYGFLTFVLGIAGIAILLLFFFSAAFLSDYIHKARVAGRRWARFVLTVVKCCILLIYSLGVLVGILITGIPACYWSGHKFQYQDITGGCIYAMGGMMVGGMMVISLCVYYIVELTRKWRKEKSKEVSWTKMMKSIDKENISDLPAKELKGDLKL
jgi:hypothetical protein